MSYQKIYSREHWENFPSEKTAINRDRLNNIEGGIDAIDDRVCALDTTKVDLTKANELVKEILWDESNGTLTVVKMNGSRAVIDTKLEKLAVNFTYNPQTQQLEITLDDGTVQNVDLSSLITEYEFLDSDTIAFEIGSDGKVKAIVKNGSITESHLAPEYLSEIRTQVGRAEMSAKSADASEKSAVSSSTLAKSYAVGGTGTRDGEDTDNAKYYAEQAKNASDVGALSEIVENHISDKIVHMTESEHDVVSKLGESAEGSLTYNGSEIKPSVATTESTGVVKPDGTTITIDDDGTLHGVTEVTVDDALSGVSTNPVQNKVIAGEINTLKKSVSDGKTLVATAITDKGVETAADATFAVMAENISQIETGGGELHGATLAVSTEESTLFGQTVTLTLNGASVASTLFADNGVCSFVVQNPGTYTITCGEARNDVTVTGDNVVNKTVISVELSLLKIVAFAAGTDEEIAKMIQAHYNNKINIADYWAVGDMRTVHLSAMAATGVGESHRAQTVQFVIGDFNHDDLTTPINGHTKAAVTLLQKDCLMDATSASNVNNGSADTEKGYMNSTNTNVGGWKNCARRTWCNNVFFVSLPSVWQSMVKTVNKKTSIGNNQSTIETVQDKIFLAAEIEIFGSAKYSFAGEGTQYQYYKNATANRYKMPKWGPSTSFDTIVSNIYWDRSPCSGNASNFCAVRYNGGQGTYSASSAYGVAPGLCI